MTEEEAFAYNAWKFAAITLFFARADAFREILFAAPRELLIAAVGWTHDQILALIGPLSDFAHGALNFILIFSTFALFAWALVTFFRKRGDWAWFISIWIVAPVIVAEVFMAQGYPAEP